VLAEVTVGRRVSQRDLGSGEPELAAKSPASELVLARVALSSEKDLDEVLDDDLLVEKKPGAEE
jgi:hypothetical protein